MNLLNQKNKQEFMSDVEQNKNLLVAGDIVLAPGGAKFQITEINLDEDYFACQDIETNAEDYFCFDSLQIDWYVLNAQNEYMMQFREV